VPVDALADNADDMFSAENSGAAAGIQLSAVNKDVIGGIGAGVEVSGISDLGLYDGIVGGLMQNADAGHNNVTAEDVETSAAITQAYLTYATGNTSFKLGRQNLPKGLSPFAFSEGWNVFKNSFEALLVVNTDLPNTVLVGAYVTQANTHGALNATNDIAGANDGVLMVTAQNTAVEGVTLTGSFYNAMDVAGVDDVQMLWLDAKTAVAGLDVALQGGTIMANDIGEDTTAFGAQVGGKFGGVSASLAYSSVDDGSLPIHNYGAGVKTPLYTQMVLNQAAIKSDSDTFVARLGMAALGGNVGLAYDFSDTASGDYNELDLTYKTKVGENTSVFAGYVWNDHDAWSDSNNFVRVWARYNF
jgi:hypothetical protein